MLAAQATFSGGGVNPVYHGSKEDNGAILNGTTIRAGTVMGLVTGTGSAVNEVQTLTVTGTPTGGTITLTYAGQIVGTIAYNSTVAQTQAVIDAFFGSTTVGAGTKPVVVGGGTLPGATQTFTFSGTEVSGMGHALMTSLAALTGGTTPAAAITRTAIGKPASGYWAPYASGNADGSQVARRIMKYDVTSNQFGQITVGQSDLSGYGGANTRAVPMYFSGAFRCRDLIGLDAGAVTNLGKLINAAAYTESQAIIVVTGY